MCACRDPPDQRLADHGLAKHFGFVLGRSTLVGCDLCGRGLNINIGLPWYGRDPGGGGGGGVLFTEGVPIPLVNRGPPVPIPLVI